MAVVINGTTGVSGVDGSAGTPSYQGTDSNTGIFFPAADTIAFAEGGAESMRIDSSGRVQIGKTSSLAANVIFEAAITDTTTAISSGAGAAISIQNLSTTNNTYSTIYFTNGGSGVDSAIYGLHEVGNGTGTGRTGSLVFATANLGGGISERARITSGGNLDLQTNLGLGGTSATTSGTGITFPATQSASTDANTLDDYEEGTWTPVLSFGGASVGITYTTQTGAYRKIGSFVYFYIRISLSSKGNSTGIVAITLPFTSINVSSGYSGTRPSYFNSINTRTPDNIGFGADAGAATGTFYTSDGGLTLTDANFQNASDFVVSGCYVSNN